jgi:uncharacterized protein (TIGR00299 family) protein
MRVVKESVENAGRRVLYFDLVGGAAGDMLLAALIDAGASVEVVMEGIRAMGLAVALETRLTYPAGIRARRLEVVIGPAVADPDGHGHGPDYDGGVHRPYRMIRDRLLRASIHPKAKAIALDAFQRLAAAEGMVHGVDAEDVEFHEVGSDDAIADVVGVAVAIAELCLEEIVTSPVPLGRGLARSAHGPIPLPGPATVELLKGVPVEGVSLQGETVTPTGAALLRAISTRFGAAPAMTIEAIGVGAGHREWPDRPNVVRALLGRPSEELQTASDEDCLVEANIDDMTPELVGPLKKALFRAGALDVWSIPIAMKKDRPGILVSALVRRSLEQATATTFFDHSTTLGVRITPVTRIRAERRIEDVETPFGRVRIKIAKRPHGPALLAPEFDDCERLAEEHGVPVRAVMEAALEAFRGGEGRKE